ncbi:MAG: TlpA family protein disulfide reductase [Magnetovibrio sp.]|nr:TlpA family protein disulfide reductase [Magnetovibrio sp.]
MNNLISQIRMAGIGFVMVALMTTGVMAKQALNPMAGKPMAPDFKLKNLDGQFQSLSDFKGKVVIINFWATWCPPCRAEMPSMQRAWEKIQDKGVMMLAIHVGGNEDKIWSFVGDYELDFTVLIDAKSRVADAWPMQGLPSTFVIDPQGRIIYRAIGAREWDDDDILEQVYALRE